jgi:hypothetical protein
MQAAPDGQGGWARARVLRRGAAAAVSGCAGCAVSAVLPCLRLCCGAGPCACGGSSTHHHPGRRCHPHAVTAPVPCARATRARVTGGAARPTPPRPPCVKAAQTRARPQTPRPHAASQPASQPPPSLSTRHTRQSHACAHGLLCRCPARTHTHTHTHTHTNTHRGRTPPRATRPPA